MPHQTIDFSDKIAAALPDDTPTDVWEYVDTADWTVEAETGIGRTQQTVTLDLDPVDMDRIRSQLQTIKEMLPDDSEGERPDVSEDVPRPSVDTREGP